MIITDIAQIDHIAEETFGTTKGIVSVDMNDYKFFRDNSQLLKMIRLDVPSLTEEIVHSLDEAIIEAGKENICSVLLYIKSNGKNAGTHAITVEQFNIFSEALNKYIDTANIIWGMSNDNENAENISILIILGYGKRE